MKTGPLITAGARNGKQRRFPTFGQGRREVPGGEHFPDKGIKSPTLTCSHAQEHAGVEQSST
jgi:hypothetical protein